MGICTFYAGNTEDVGEFYGVDREVVGLIKEPVDSLLYKLPTTTKSCQIPPYESITLIKHGF